MDVVESGESWVTNFSRMECKTATPAGLVRQMKHHNVPVGAVMVHRSRLKILYTFLSFQKKKPSRRHEMVFIFKL